MSFIALSEQIINGFIISIFYMLGAIGLSLIFGALKIVNFAHGELYMLGGYVYFVFASMMGIPPELSILTATLIMFFVGMAVATDPANSYWKGRTNR